MSRKQRNRGMKKYIPLAAMLTVLFPLSGHAEEKNAGGEIALTPTLANVNGSKAKFNEYRDIQDGLYGALRLWKETDDSFFRFQADDILYDTQSYRFDGGSYGQYKYNLFYDEIPHNRTFDARTPLSGIHGSTLTYTGAGGTLNAENPPVATWNTFDYEVKRKKGGAGIRLDLLKPYYVDLAISREDREGLKPTATSWNAIAGGGTRRVLEMPEPLDYTTDHIKAEVGYSLTPFFGAVSYTYSKFDNANSNLFYEHPNTIGTLEAISLPPDNDYYKLAFRGKAILPMNSGLNVNIGRSVAESTFDLRQQYLSDIGNPVLITLSDTVFDGKVETTNYDVILTSDPLPYAGGKLFYKNYNKSNKSDEITVTDGARVFHNHLFDYDKETIGAEVGFKLPAHLSLTPSYKRVKTERERGDFPETKDDVYGLDLRWTGSSYLTVSAGYEKLDRSSDWQQPTTVIPGDQANANLIEPFVRRFDAAPQDRDTYKLSLDIFPTDSLSVGLGYENRKVDYKHELLGLREEESDFYIVSADYTIGRVALAGYYSYEKTEFFQFQRRLTNAANANPALGFNAANNYNWSFADESKTYDYGLSAQYVVVPNTWRVKVQYDHVRSDGFGDFTLYDGAAIAGFNNDTLDFQNWDDYKLNSFQIKAIYDISQNLSTTVGYAHERYRYSDAQLDDYDFRINSNDFLSGAFKDQSYEANVFYTTVKYSF
jgi:MtrB/PioB family decaheme-associated outer membrane protein